MRQSDGERLRREEQGRQEEVATSQARTGAGPRGPAPCAASATGGTAGRSRAPGSGTCHRLGSSSRDRLARSNSARCVGFLALDDLLPAPRPGSRSVGGPCTRTVTVARRRDDVRQQAMALVERERVVGNVTRTRVLERHLCSRRPPEQERGIEAHQSSGLASSRARRCDRTCSSVRRASRAAG